MRSISRVLGTALLSLPLLGFAACGQDNEDFVKAQASANATKEDGKSKGESLQTSGDYAAQQKKQMQSQQNQLKQAGYPGAK